MGIVHLDHPDTSRGIDNAEVKCRGFIIDPRTHELSFCDTPITNNNSLIQRNYEFNGSIFSTIFNFVLGHYSLPTILYDEYNRRFSAIIKHVYCRKCMCHIGCKFVRVVNKRNLYKNNCFLIDDIMVY